MLWIQPEPSTPGAGANRPLFQSPSPPRPWATPCSPQSETQLLVELLAQPRGSDARFAVDFIDKGGSARQPHGRVGQELLQFLLQCGLPALPAPPGLSPSCPTSSLPLLPFQKRDIDFSCCSITRFFKHSESLPSSCSECRLSSSACIPWPTCSLGAGAVPLFTAVSPAHLPHIWPPVGSSRTCSE